MSQEEKIFLGNGKKVEFTNGGSILKMRFSEDHLRAALKYCEENGQESRSGKMWIGVNFQERKQPDDYGNTHYGVIDTWKPDPNYTGKPSAQKKKEEEKHSVPEINYGQSKVGPNDLPW